MFETRALRTSVGPKEDKVIKGWRELHNEKLPNMLSSPNTDGLQMKDVVGGAC
jgi:hypothetical protein